MIDKNIVKGFPLFIRHTKYCPLAKVLNKRFVLLNDQQYAEQVTLYAKNQKYKAKIRLALEDARRWWAREWRIREDLKRIVAEAPTSILEKFRVIAKTRNQTIYQMVCQCEDMRRIFLTAMVEITSFGVSSRHWLINRQTFVAYHSANGAVKQPVNGGKPTGWKDGNRVAKDKESWLHSTYKVVSRPKDCVNLGKSEDYMVDKVGKLVAHLLKD